MAAARQAFYTTGLVLLSLAISRAAEAQVGIGSGLARVGLVARSAPQGFVHSVTPAHPTAGVGQLVEASMMVQLSANSGYRLVVLGTSSSKIWVRDINGEYQNLTSGSPVTVAGGTHGAGQWESRVHYRVELGESGEVGPLPVRLEMRINPTM